MVIYTCKLFLPGRAFSLSKSATCPTWQSLQLA